MKNTAFTLFISLFLAILAHSQDRETRSLDRFEAVHVATGINATLQAGQENSVKISAKGIDLDRVITEIKGGELIVKIRTKWMNWNHKKHKVKATITYSGTIDGLAASSGAYLLAEDALLSDRMELDASSGAGLKANVISQKVAVDISSGARIEASGTTDYLIVDISSGSRFEGYDLKAKDVNVDGSSGASARVHVSGSLEADVSSGSSVKYKGTPTSRDVDKSSGGSVRAASGI